MTSSRTRIGPLDAGIAAVALVLATVYMAMQVPDETVEATWAAVPFFALCAVPLVWRRVAPLHAAVGLLALTGLHVALFTDDVVRCGILLVITLVLGFAAGARLDMPLSAVALAVNLGTTALVCATDHPTGADIAAFYGFIGPILLGVWGVGVLVRHRGRMVGELEARNRQLREARDERARMEVAGDRQRLSAELDRLVSTRLGALAELADRGAEATDPAASAEVLARIETESRATLEEMRAVVGVLRDADDGAETAPPPTLTQLDALLVRAKGTDARLHVTGHPRALPAAVELSAYRVVEHLLEALQDAPGVEVGVEFTDDSLRLRVTGPLRRRGAAAVQRARERARLHHGDVEITTASGRADAVVSLPLYAAV